MTVEPESDAPLGSTAVIGSNGPHDAERRAPTSERWALITFLAFLFASFWLLLLKFGSKRWFYGDDWGFLLTRMNPSIDTLLTPQHGHLSTVPILVFETLYRVFGIRTYVPYLVAIITLHLAVAVLLRVIMRRAGVGPWLATAFAGMIVLFGPGQETILYAIQISQVGTIVLGLTQMLLADHDGPLDRRDWIGLGVGFVSLFCSALAPAMIVAVGVAVLIRRGWRPAMFHTVPLGVVFVAWYLKYSIHLPSETAGLEHGYPLTDYARAVWVGESASINALGHFAVLGVAFAIMLVVGLVIAWIPLELTARRRTFAMPLALLVGAIGYQLLTGFNYLKISEILGNDFDATFNQSRSLYVIAALTLPALALAAQGLISRWPLVAPIIYAAVLVAIVANATQLDDSFKDQITTGESHFIEQLSVSPILGGLPSETKVGINANAYNFGTLGLTAGWMTAAKDAGRISEPERIDDATQVKVMTKLGLAQGTSPPDDASRCPTVAATQVITPGRGDALVVDGQATVGFHLDGRKLEPAATYDAKGGTTLNVLADGLELSVSTPGQTFRWCKA